MTRLASDDVKSISSELSGHDAELKARTGHSLRSIGCLAVGLPENEIQHRLKSARIGVVPINAGEGVIAGFSDAVAGIVSHLGCKTFITRASDVAGLGEAFKKKADIIMLSDDHQFIALHAPSGQLIENAAATGKGFATGMHLMAGDLSKRNVLVIGCGPVGKSATEALVAMGACVSIHDINPARSTALSETLKNTDDADIQVLGDLNRALEGHKLIIDASPAADIIQARHIQPDSYISAPGVPTGLDQDARMKIGNRLLHDPLQIGVATMVISAFKFHIQLIENR